MTLPLPQFCSLSHWELDPVATGPQGLEGWQASSQWKASELISASWTKYLILLILLIWLLQLTMVRSLTGA